MEPAPDIGVVFDEHVAAEFVDMDLDATMATMTDDPYVNHLPVDDRRCRRRGSAPVLRRRTSSGSGRRTSR